MRKRNRRNINFYKGKRLVFINIDHVVRYSRSGAAYIIEAADIAIDQAKLPIVRKLNTEGYTVIGVSHQLGIGQYGFEQSEFLTGLRQMMFMLKPELLFDFVFYSWEGTKNFYDEKLLTDAMAHAKVFSRHCLYVGYLGIEQEACEYLGIEFVPYDTFFQTLVYKRDVESW